MNNYIKVAIALQSPEQADMLVAQLTECGYEGFEESENELGVYHLYAFIPEPGFSNNDLSAILSMHALAFSKQVIKEKNWNEEWEKNFDPVVVKNFCAIRASFHKPVKGVKIDIEITPKMSFGTGHHPTTCLMIEAMEQVDFREKAVFDFGTGTGVLAILAEKLGANKVHAVDIDDWSIENAKENISRNGCRAVSVEKSNAISSTGFYPIILANINKNVILANLHAISQQLTTGGVLLLSGLLVQDFEEVKSGAATQQLDIVSSLNRESWLCLRLEKIIPEKGLTLA